MHSSLEKLLIKWFYIKFEDSLYIHVPIHATHIPPICKNKIHIKNGQVTVIQVSQWYNKLIFWNLYVKSIFKQIVFPFGWLFTHLLFLPSPCFKTTKSILDISTILLQSANKFILWNNEKYSESWKSNSFVYYEFAR